jgi:hypothetical protein
MKKIIVLAIIAIFLAVTNPNKSDYSEWAITKMKENGNALTNFGVSLLGKPIIENSTAVHNYIVFSTFETQLLDKKVTTLGIFKNFIPLQQ